ncbi:MAG: hypothetical protein LBQ59_01020 [Candidatus Peribacteria bacterium]|jgi:hypothetical protein|nr:hypothetical protein [Candidatus Peribacteria bacterium]
MYAKKAFSKLFPVSSKLSSQKFLSQLSTKNTFGIFVISHLIFPEKGVINFKTKVFSKSKIQLFKVFIEIQIVLEISLKFTKLQLCSAKSFKTLLNLSTSLMFQISFMSF